MTLDERLLSCTIIKALGLYRLLVYQAYYLLVIREKVNRVQSE